MRRVLKPILLGLLISAAAMACLYSAALMGSHEAVNLLLKLTIKPFNLAATFMEPQSPDGVDAEMRALDFMLLAAWIQIGLVAAALLAVAKAAIPTSKD